MNYKSNKITIGLEQTWRWFGHEDPVPLSHIKMVGATGIVTALHHIPNGQFWSTNEIMERKRIIENSGLKWSVVESVPVHEDIKKRSGKYIDHIENYKKTIQNLGQAGVDTLCYNFMPVLDWTRTDLDFEMPDGTKALHFDMSRFIVFDLFLLQRVGAETEYSESQIKEAEIQFMLMTDEEKTKLTNTILAGLPGAEESYSLQKFNSVLEGYQDIGTNELRQNLIHFLEEIVPVAEKSGVNLAIHPDDPPFPIFGLPRIVSTENDIEQIIKIHDSPNNGLCFCTGSLGVIPNNELKGIVERFGHRINFVHLRSTKRDGLGSFHESDHLNGDVDMYGVVKALLEEQQTRIELGRPDYRLPMRPDHGHQMLYDLDKRVNPGYSAIGRLRGLAELRGLEMGIRQSCFS